MTAHTYLVQEISVYMEALKDRILAIERSIEVMRKSQGPQSKVFIEHLVMWRNRLIHILGDIELLASLLSTDKRLQAKVKSCRLREDLYSILASSKPEDPIYQNLKSLLSRVMATLEGICKTQ